MCTVTFISNRNGFTLTSSRDEIASRGETQFPIEKQLTTEKIYFPQDPLAGGTWIATSELGKVVCLLNGGFEKHKHQPPYRFSRGKVVLDSFSFKNFDAFGNEYNLKGVEPFTLILIDNSSSETKLYELVWDGYKKHFTELSSGSNHIWSSSTLYKKEIREIRQTWFKDWLLTNGESSDSLFNFHLTAGDLSDAYNIKMKRENGPETVSITQVSLHDNRLNKRHLNFLMNQDNQTKIELKALLHA